MFVCRQSCYKVVKNVDVKTNSTAVMIHFAINCASVDMNLFLIPSVARFRSTLVNSETMSNEIKMYE